MDETHVLTGLTFDELQDWVTGVMGMKPYRARQIFAWVHRRRISDIQKMTDISAAARESLQRVAKLLVLRPAEVLGSGDGTAKFSFELQDGAVVESVLIPDSPGLTACLSTQVGCACGCTFCQTGSMGFIRNLTSAEIMAQLYAMQKAAEDRISNVVFMGMGEPMNNFPRVARALSIITDDRGICIGARKITVSTVGVPGGIAALTDLNGQYGLALSLHSAVPETRLKLVPAARSMPLSELRRELLDYVRLRGRRVTLEYCLIKDVNDSVREAQALADFSRGLECKINLLVYNPVSGGSFEGPDEERVREFMHYLYPRCQAVTLRRSRGREIAAACGQLGAAPGSRKPPKP